MEQVFTVSISSQKAVDEADVYRAIHEYFKRQQVIGVSVNASQHSVHSDPPSACPDCGSFDEHIHYANCPRAKTAGR